MPTFGSLITKKKKPLDTVSVTIEPQKTPPLVPPPSNFTPNVPPPVTDTSTKTIFNPDNTITKTQGGASQIISRADYEKNMADRVRQARVNAFNAQYPESPAEIAAKVEVPETQSIAEMRKKAEAVSSPDERIIELHAEGAPAKEFVEPVLSYGAQIVDNIRVALSSGEPRTAKKATASFNTASKLTDQNIDLVKVGQMSYNDALRDFDLQMAAIVRLESSQVGIGKANTDYWVDTGAAIETRIRNEYKVMERQRQQLIDAYVESQVNAKLGMQSTSGKTQNSLENTGEVQ